MTTLFAPPSFDALTGGASEAEIPQIPQLPPPYAVSTTAFSSESGTSSSTSIIVIVIIVASAVVVSALIYILLRFLSKRFHRSFRTFAAADDVVRRHDSIGLSSEQQHQCQTTTGLLDSLPIFTFGSVTGNLTEGDCAVCLSKFERHDKLRLLPLCCHAFHAECIDAWIVSNQSCPLCRSAVVASDSDLVGKIISGENGGVVGNRSFGNGNSGSFRIEIGSISRRHGGSIDAAEGDRRAYSIGSFDYIVDENGYEVSAASITHLRHLSDCTSFDKESSIGIPLPDPPGESLAADVSGGRSWLREYVDRLASISISSRAISFRSSGRFFSGSSRRTEPSAPVEDLEAHRVGEEISELFRWLSGV